MSPVVEGVNIVCDDLPSVAAFYEALGLTVRHEEGPWEGHHAQVTGAGGTDLSLDSIGSAQVWDGAWPPGATGVVINLGYPDDAAVDAAFHHLMAGEYLLHQAPSRAFWGAHYAIAADPAGNVVILVGPVDPARRSRPPDPAAPPQPVGPGTTADPGVELTLGLLNPIVGDRMADVVAFYRAAGLDITIGDDPWAWEHVNAITTGPAHVELESDFSASVWNQGWPRNATGVSICFNVPDRPDVDTVVRHLASTGHPVMQEPIDAFWGARYGVVADPSGVAVGFMSPMDKALGSMPPMPPT